MGKRANKRAAILRTAGAMFASRGYDGTSISEIADKLSVSKAAVSYHFPSKDDILFELATPLLEKLEDVIAAHPDPDWPEEVWALVGDYFDVLVDDRDIAVWLDSDRSVQVRPEVGGRLRHVNAQLRRTLTPNTFSRPSDNVRSLAALGGLWRPLRNLQPDELKAHREEIIHAALVSVAPIEVPHPAAG